MKLSQKDIAFVIKQHLDGYRISTIQRQLKERRNVSVLWPAVKKIQKNFEAGSIDRLGCRRKYIRPCSVVTDFTINLVSQLLNENPLQSAVAIHQSLRDLHGIELSLTSTKILIKKAGFTASKKRVLCDGDNAEYATKKRKIEYKPTRSSNESQVDHIHSLSDEQSHSPDSGQGRHNHSLSGEQSHSSPDHGDSEQGRCSSPENADATGIRKEYEDKEKMISRVGLII